MNSTLLHRGRTTIFRLHRVVQRHTIQQHLNQRIRFESTQAKPVQTTTTAATEAKPANSILNAQGWYSPLLGPFRAFDRAHRRRPLFVQFLSSIVIYFFGDLSAQAISTSNFKEGQYEPVRAARAMIIGGSIAIPGYKWFLYLATHFNYSSKVGSLLLKIALNQAVFTPAISAYFFAMQSLLSGASLQDAWIRVRDTVPISWKNSFKVWPAVMAFNFTYVPLQFRSIFAGVIAIGWQSYLSWLNKLAELKEKGTETQRGASLLPEAQ